MFRFRSNITEKISEINDLYDHVSSALKSKSIKNPIKSSEDKQVT